MTPPDPDLYAREQAQLAREALAVAREANRASRRSNRIAIAFGVVAAVVAAVALYPQFRSDSRDQGEVNDKERIEAGSPVKLSPGDSFNFSGWWTTNKSLGDDHAGEIFDSQAYDLNKPSFAWLYKHWTPLNHANISVNTLSVHEKTTLVQGIEISKLECTTPVSRTLLGTPEIGSGGDITPPATYAVKVEEPKPVLRKLVDNLPGEPSEGNLTLEQGDQRTIQLSFFSTRKSCTFEAALKISSNGKAYKVKLPSIWDEGGEPDDYTFRVTAPPVNYTYKTYYVTESRTETALRPHIVQVPSDRIVWKENNRPEYVGPA
ncbi:hypothetical protein [Streptomyces atratus]